MRAMTRVLVLKLGAFGNMVLSFGAFAAIRRHHARDDVTLLTTEPYATWMGSSPWFDDVLVDVRPSWWNLPAMLQLRRTLREGRFERVYDLQTSSRSSRYLQLFPRASRPEWSGIAADASHPDRNPDRNRIHDSDRQREQLRQSGIQEFPQPDLSWCRGDLAEFDLPRRFALLVPGSAPHRLAKRWPAAHYRALARTLSDQQIVPLVLGSQQEESLAAAICEGSGALDLTGRTSFCQLAELGRRALFAVGNDTGPMHLLASVGCRSLVLFSHDSDPTLCAPRAPAGTVPVGVLRRSDLAALSLDDVTAALPIPVEALG